LSEWEPATEAELAMHNALVASDQELYFRILARTEILLPVSAEALAGRAPMGWGTWTTGNRTHVLAFTSPEALWVCLNDPSGSYRSVPFHALASEWPNYEWWLAVNPGLPVEAYLPSWFVSQLTRDEERRPDRPVGTRARMAQSDLAAALSGRVRASAPAPTLTRGSPIPAQSGPAAAMDPRVVGPNGVETVEAEIIDYPEDQATSRVYPAGTYGPETTAPSRPGLGALLSGEAVLEDPTFRFSGSDGPSTATSGYGVRAGSVRQEDRETVAAAAFVADVPAPAPSPLLSPPGPAGGKSGSSGAKEAHDAEIVSGDAWASGFAPANETESNLLAAAEENNTDSFLSTLLLARIILPVPLGMPGTAKPHDRDFPWQIEEIDGKPFIAVYTSPERLAEHKPIPNPGRTSVSLRFVQLIGAWPDEEISFAINPGSPVGATLPGSEIVALAAWAAEVGLRDEPAADVVVAAKKNESTPSVGVAGGPANGADRATVMQRTVPHAQVPFYLERGYDRVSGFVNRASEVAHLNSPKVLYRALGLVYTGSSFSDDDAEVHMVRWVAHRADLYRLPYGGQHEAGMRAMQGWVIERPPFRGNGFAPGDTDVVAEFKVDSIRLPHGAQMWRLAKDGTETLVATFDADTVRWVTAPAPFGGLYA
jgi:hypothetical protein